MSMIPDRYNTEKFKEAVRNPHMFKQELGRLISAESINSSVQKRVADIRNVGINHAEEDWDTLFILDACRADLFEEVVDTDSYDYRRVRSNASATPEWTRLTWRGGGVR